MDTHVRFMFSGDKQFREVVELVKDKYLEKHHADAIGRKNCYLVYEESKEGKTYISAAMAIIPSEKGELFSETYFDEPIESVITKATGKVIRREQIVEAGNLASKGGRGTALRLLQLAPLFLWCKGYDYALITGTKQVRFILNKAGIEMVPICSASIDRLPEEDREAWGNYYENDPVCGWIDLKKFAIQFMENKPVTYELANIIFNVRKDASETRDGIFA